LTASGTGDLVTVREGRPWSSRRECSDAAATRGPARGQAL